MKVLTPMIAKMSQKMMQTVSTLKILGRAPTNAFTTTFMPSILAMALSGRKALRVLIVLKIGMFPAPRREAAKLMRDTPTMTKSSQHQALLK